MTAQRGDSVRPPASSFTDRRGADDATFADVLARLDRQPGADIDTVERVARAIYQAETSSARFMAGPDCSDTYRRLARAAIAALKPAPGTHSGRADNVIQSVTFPKNPGQPVTLTTAADTPDQVVQSDVITGSLRIGDHEQVLTINELAPGHWELYRVNDVTVDWRYVVDDPAAVAGPQHDGQAGDFDRPHGDPS